MDLGLSFSKRIGLAMPWLSKSKHLARRKFSRERSFPCSNTCSLEISPGLMQRLATTRSNNHKFYYWYCRSTEITETRSFPRVGPLAGANCERDLERPSLPKQLWRTWIRSSMRHQLDPQSLKLKHPEPQTLVLKL